MGLISNIFMLLMNSFGKYISLAWEWAISSLLIYYIIARKVSIVDMTLDGSTYLG
jgi:hypothetical protein